MNISHTCHLIISDVTLKYCMTQKVSVRTGVRIYCAYIAFFLDMHHLESVVVVSAYGLLRSLLPKDKLPITSLLAILSQATSLHKLLVPFEY